MRSVFRHGDPHVPQVAPVRCGQCGQQGDGLGLAPLVGGERDTVQDGVLDVPDGLGEVLRAVPPLPSEAVF